MKNLLIIDDDERIRKIMRIQLHTEYNVYDAEKKDIAFQILTTVPVDVIICDIKMKDSNGFVILKELKEKYPDIPVIMLTGFIDKSMSDKAKKMGCFDFITKPVRREKLKMTINKALQKEMLH
ncbi:MAG: response regulator [Spirochaetales bacterium]|nr:response regulator [Spirochaetales bacterium]